jgi:16S rRNA processing protein RimM
VAERVVLGRVVGAHALRGQVRVRYFGDGPDNLLGVDRVWLTESAEDPSPEPYDIVSGGSGRAGEARIGFEGVRDREAAQSLRGLLVLADEAQLDPPEEDAYYWHQLVGCGVETSEGRLIGDVVELWETGAHDVLVIENAGGRRQLIPTAREFMIEVDLERRRIVVRDVPGLLELE